MFTADAHCDTLLRLESGLPPGPVSLDTLRRGGVGLQVFALFHGGRPPLTGALRRALDQRALLSRLHIPLLTGPLPEQPPLEPAAVLSIEGSEILEDSLEALARFRRLGVRMMNLTWNHPNTAGIPALAGRGPLTAFGRRLVDSMGREGVLCDVSHLNEDGFWTVLERSRLPVVASHSCAHALCSHPRNLTDRQIKALIEAGGFIGINFCPAFLREDGQATLSDICRHIDHVAQLGGIGILGLGSDFDGIDRVPEGMEDAGCYPALYERLSRMGYRPADIAAIAGGNLYRTLQRGQEVRP